MLNKFTYTEYAKSFITPPSIDKSDLEVFDKLLKLINPDWRIDGSADAKQYLDLGIITITDGKDIERHHHLELLLYRLPPILFCNNKHFLKSHKAQMVRVQTPTTVGQMTAVQVFYRKVERYYKLIRKQTI